MVDITLGLEQYGVEYSIIGILASVIVYLYTKLMEAKDNELEQVQRENERNELTRETLERTTDNILALTRQDYDENNTQK